MALFRRGGIWYGRVKDSYGRWIARTLNTTDAIVAKVRYRELERREADPHHHAEDEATIATAAAEFVTSRAVKGCSNATLSMYDQKIAHLGRLLGSDLPLAHLDAAKVDAYCATRLTEGAARNTIGKELTALRGLLKVAKRNGKFTPDLAAVLPLEWSNDYVPRRTALTPEQVAFLLAALDAPRMWVDARGRAYSRERNPNRAAFVGFVVATGARLSEAFAAERPCIDLARELVYFRITKTRRKGKREKYVPITALNRALIARVLVLTEGREGRLFDPWPNVVRDLSEVCAALGIPRVTPNDLRRTHANWLRDAGVDLASIADVLGHTDSRMVETVYGKLRPEQLRDAVIRAVGVH